MLGHLGRIVGDDFLRRTLDALERAGDEIATTLAEEERFADFGLAGVREQRAVHEEANAAEKLTPQREVTR